MPSHPVPGLLTRYAARLRFPRLLALTATLFLVDLVVPDAIPFIDEILLGLGTLVLANLKRRHGGRELPGDPPR
jgi:hypothetical protein